jgi:hypothetical protein
MSLKIRTYDFVKHDLKEVLKCIGVQICSPPPPPTDRDRYSCKPNTTVGIL